MIEGNKPNDGDQDQNPEKALQSPSVVPREKLISTAVDFLQNPKVKSSSTSMKTAFLQKKGLTDEEIKIALDRCSINATIISPHPLASVPSNQLVPAPHAVISKPFSIFYHINRVGSSLIIVGIALYGISRFYKLYIEPWLFGKETEESRFSIVEQQLLEMNRSMSQLKRTVSSLEESINSQKEQVDKIFENEVNDYYTTPLALNDLKSEVSSIKSLLLSRHQFPAAPKVGPSIPIWQMVKDNAAENESDEDEKKLDESAESVSETVIVNGDQSTDVKEAAVEKSEILVGSKDNEKGDQNKDVTETDKGVIEKSSCDNETVYGEWAESLQAS